MITETETKTATEKNISIIETLMFFLQKKYMCLACQKNDLITEASCRGKKISPNHPCALLAYKGRGSEEERELVKIKVSRSSGLIILSSTTWGEGEVLGS